MTPAFERSGTVHALERATTVIDDLKLPADVILTRTVTFKLHFINTVILSLWPKETSYALFFTPGFDVGVKCANGLVKSTYTADSLHNLKHKTAML
jgi:hypothetical protein